MPLILAVAGLLAGAADVSAPLSGPTTPTAFAAPVYTCTITSGARSVNRTTRIPIRLREAGPDTVGSTDTVTLSSPGAALGGRSRRAPPRSGSAARCRSWARRPTPSRSPGP